MVLDGGTDNQDGKINVLSISRPKLELGFQLGGSSQMSFSLTLRCLCIQWYNHIALAYVYINEMMPVELAVGEVSWSIIAHTFPCLIGLLGFFL